MVRVQYIVDQAFVRNKGGYTASVAVAMFVIVVGVSMSSPLMRIELPGVSAHETDLED